MGICAIAHSQLLWASLNDTTADTDRHENHHQFGLTVLDSSD